jgi:hypothetical protein
MSANTLTVERVRELFTYDAETGLFTRVIRSAANAPAGSVAGGPSGYGYWRVSIDGERYQAHRLAWFYTHGGWPSADIDHINGDRSDNRLANLRDVSRTVNNQNRKTAKRGTKVGLLGVTRNGSGYMSQIKIDGAYKYLGTYRTPVEAHEAYINAKRVFHPGNTL